MGMALSERGDSAPQHDKVNGVRHAARGLVNWRGKGSFQASEHTRVHVVSRGLLGFEKTRVSVADTSTPFSQQEVRTVTIRNNPFGGTSIARSGGSQEYGADGKLKSPKSVWFGGPKEIDPETDESVAFLSLMKNADPQGFRNSKIDKYGRTAEQRKKDGNIADEYRERTKALIKLGEDNGAARELIVKDDPFGSLATHDVREVEYLPDDHDVSRVIVKGGGQKHQINVTYRNQNRSGEVYKVVKGNVLLRVSKSDNGSLTYTPIRETEAANFLNLLDSLGMQHLRRVES